MWVYVRVQCTFFKKRIGCNSVKTSNTLVSLGEIVDVFTGDDAEKKVNSNYTTVSMEVQH